MADFLRMEQKDEAYNHMKNWKVSYIRTDEHWCAPDYPNPEPFHHVTR